MWPISLPSWKHLDFVPRANVLESSTKKNPSGYISEQACLHHSPEPWAVIDMSTYTRNPPPHLWATAPNLGYRLPSAWELLPLMPRFKWLEVRSSRLFQTSRGFKCAAWVENHCSRIMLPHRVAICEYLKLETWTSNQIKNQFPDCTSHIQLLGAHGFSRWERTDLPCLHHHGWSCPGSSNESQEYF